MLEDVDECRFQIAFGSLTRRQDDAVEQRLFAGVVIGLIGGHGHFVAHIVARLHCLASRRRVGPSGERARELFDVLLGVGRYRRAGLIKLFSMSR